MVGSVDAVMAMRHAPYTTCSALAELIDNSLQAGAENIAVIAVDKDIRLTQRFVRQLDQLAVMDDGCGMDADVLADCLAVGFSRNKEERNGIGKFGYGMSVGSISQCYRTEIYSWQEGGPILYTYCDLKEFEEDNNTQIPTPVEVKELPIVGKHKWDKTMKKRKSGTLVIWRNLDKTRTQVSTSGGIIGRFFVHLARIYRHFLDDDNTIGRKRNIEIINMTPDMLVEERKTLLANDPLYLLTPNTLLDDVKNKKKYSEQATNVVHAERQLDIEFENEEGKTETSPVEIIFTIAKPEIRQAGGMGSALGRHYQQNQGISFVRAGREIELNTFKMVNIYDTRERWWSCAIHFKPDLDPLFGVSADKQRILNISGISRAGTVSVEDEDPAVQLNIAINKIINEEVSKLRVLIKNNPVKRGGKKGKGGIIEKVNIRVKKSKKTTASQQDSAKLTKKKKIEHIKSVLVANNPEMTDKEAESLAKEKIDLQVDWILRSWAGTTFLDVERAGGGVQAQLNTRSQFHKVFYSTLEDMEDPKAEWAMRIMLMAFARTEDELYPELDPKRVIFPKIRDRWGYWIEELIPISED